MIENAIPEIRLHPEKDIVISLKEVALHDSYNDCWIVLYNRVYDVTSFLQSHPGGQDVIVECGGRDATFTFKGAGHTVTNLSALKQFEIGRLPEKEHLPQVLLLK